MTQKKFFKNIALIGLLSPVLLIAQTVWIKHPTPVLTRSATFPDWNGLAAGDAIVMKDNDTLKMWYSGSGWLSSTDDCSHIRIGYAWSLNGINWNEHPSNPVLDIGSDSTSFDYDGVETPYVIKDLVAPANQRYKLWYAGRHSRCQPINDHKFGYAFSPDGINWTKYSGNPVLVPGNSSDWYNTFLSSPSVLFEGGIYKMWFTAPDLVINGQPTDGKGNIGYATSPNGINWTVNPSPVLIAGDQSNWDSASIAEPSVLKIGATYYMFYSALDQWKAENFQVGYAWSSDGISWTKSAQNPVLKIGNKSQWDRYWASHPGVMFDSVDNKLKMWYTGRDTATIVSLAGYYWDIGYAESTYPVGINNIHKEDGIKIYPIPSNGILNIAVPFELRNGELSIYNLSGIVVKNIKTNENVEINLDVSALSAGVYFLELKKEGKQLHSKIIISH
ncbi:MAG: T9SS type A sorting domain-containing protein [Bacteroidia bacterium]|nr:T9SS type A sorting domain-containing protein [Bacteroidia bacterium]